MENKTREGFKKEGVWSVENPSEKSHNVRTTNKHCTVNKNIY